MRIALIAKRGHEHTGVGRYTKKLSAALLELGHEVLIVNPTVPLPQVLARLVHQLLGWDLNAFFNNYPIWARYPQADIYHLTSQNLATLLLLRRPPGPTVITVHDIIAYVMQNQPISYDHLFEKYFDFLAIRNLQEAISLITVSEHTRRCLINSLSIPPEKIIVTLEGVS